MQARRDVGGWGGTTGSSPKAAEMPPGSSCPCRQVETLKVKLLEQAQEISRLRSELVSCPGPGLSRPHPEGCWHRGAPRRKGTRGTGIGVKPSQGRSLGPVSRERDTYQGIFCHEGVLSRAP